MKTFIVAEIGPNHNGSVELAINMIERIAASGADAVKFQLCVPEAVYSLDAFKPGYQKRNDKYKTPLEMSKSFQLTFEDHKLLYRTCKKIGISYMCTAFDLKSLIFIDRTFDLPFFKIASGEIFSLDMLDYISKRDRPIILSTGMAAYDEIETALEILNRNFKKEIILMHCVSSYPARPEDINLKAIPELKQKFNYRVGFSDHTLGIECALSAVALGAEFIEKHVTLDRAMSGPDHKASATIDEFSRLVKGIRNVEKAMGESEKSFSESELEIKKASRKSIIAARDISRDEIIKDSDICFKRPGTGISPLEKEYVIGKKAKKNIARDRLIKKEDIGE